MRSCFSVPSFWCFLSRETFSALRRCGTAPFVLQLNAEISKSPRVSNMVDTEGRRSGGNSTPSSTLSGLWLSSRWIELYYACNWSPTVPSRAFSSLSIVSHFVTSPDVTSSFFWAYTGSRLWALRESSCTSLKLFKVGWRSWETRTSVLRGKLSLKIL